MPKVSVVIPTHNRPDLLRRALKSVAAQTYRDFEVIIVDDGDSPRAESIVAEFRSSLLCHYLETSKNQGGARTRNFGIKKAQGDFIAFLDDDDEWLPEKLDKQVQALDSANNDVSLVFNGVQAYDENGKSLYVKLPNESGVVRPFKKLLRKCYIWTSALMVRKSFTDLGFIFDEDLKKNQEWDLELRLSKVSQFYAINEPLTRLNIGESEQMGSKKNLHNILAGTEKFLAKHYNDYKDNPKALSLRLFYLGLLAWEMGEVRKARNYWRRSWRFDLFFLVPLKDWLLSWFGVKIFNHFKSKQSLLDS